MRDVNPYSFGRPLDGQPPFVGRDKILEDIFTELQGGRFPGMVSLFGARNIGTTSLLLATANPYVQRRFATGDSAGWKFILMDLKEFHIVSPETLTRAFVDAAASALQMRFTQTSPCHADIKRVADAIDKRGRPLVVLVDEVDRIIEMREHYVFMDSFFYILGNRGGKKINILTASKRPLYELFSICQQRFGAQDLGSPFFVHFRPLRVGLFTPKETKELVIGVSTRAGHSLEGEYQKILQLGGGFPHFLQIACYLTYEMKARRKRLSAGDWQKIREHFEARSAPYYQYFWDNFSELEKGTVVEIASGNPGAPVPVDSQTILSGFLHMIPQTYRQEKDRALLLLR